MLKINNNLSKWYFKNINMPITDYPFDPSLIEEKATGIVKLSTLSKKI